MNKRTWILYMHKNKINGKVYIGITCQSDDPNKRWQRGKHYETNKHFTSAINKYGWDSFEHIILREGIPTEEEATQLEKETIEKYHATDRRYGYNKLEGGKGYHSGYKMTPEHKQHMMEAIKRFQEDPNYEEWRIEHKELARQHALRMWESERELLLEKSKETREANKEKFLNTPVCRTQESKGYYWGVGQRYIIEVYPNINEISKSEEEKENILRIAKRSSRQISKGEKCTEEWIFVKDAIKLYKDFNPIVKYDLKESKISKIYCRENSINKSSRKRIKENIATGRVVNKKYKWLDYKTLIKDMSTLDFYI